MAFHAAASLRLSLPFGNGLERNDAWTEESYHNLTPAALAFAVFAEEIKPIGPGQHDPITSATTMLRDLCFDKTLNAIGKGAESPEVANQLRHCGLYLHSTPPKRSNASMRACATNASSVCRSMDSSLTWIPLKVMFMLPARAKSSPVSALA